MRSLRLAVLGCRRITTEYDGVFIFGDSRYVVVPRCLML